MSPTYSSLNLVLLGPPGSGKSTQAGRLAANYNLPHISTREMLRDEVSRQTVVGNQAKTEMERGELVSDRLLAGLMLQRLDSDDCARGFILDGYPRTVDQAVLLDGILAELGRSIERVVLIDVPLELGADRLLANDSPNADSNAGIQDDVIVNANEGREGVIRERVRVWRDNAPQLIEFYRDRGLLLDVKGDDTVDEVADAVSRSVGAQVGA